MKVGSIPHRLLRLPLALVPAGRRSRVLFGPLRGARWVIGSSTHGCWLGIYERRVQNALRRMLRPGDVFYDVGANVGFYTLLGARLVGPTGSVVAVEPYQRNLAYLRDHIRLNSLERSVSVLAAAAAARAGTGHLVTENCGHHEVRLGADGSPVELVTLDGVASSHPFPNAVKIDVEGAEGEVLRGAGAVLERGPVVLLAAHGWQQMATCREILESAGYRLELLRDGARDGDYAVLATR